MFPWFPPSMRCFPQLSLTVSPKKSSQLAMASPCPGLYARPADAAQSEQWGATFHGFLPWVSWENHRTTLW
jgi:hypothetical protein